jgi:hypothetical protein
MTWEVEYTDQFEAWYRTLSEVSEAAVQVAVERLQQGGPGLGRPWVDTLHGTHSANLKELRPRGGNIRILFAFDPRRMAILLIGGDKTGRWQEWYAEMIPLAEALYADHLREIEEER